MKIRGISVGGGALAIATLLSFLIGPETFRENRSASPGIGNARAVQTSYERWKAQYERTEGDRRLVLSLGYSKGLSTRYTRAQGQVRLDLTNGAISVEASGLPTAEAFEVWLVDNRRGPGRSVKPEAGDVMLRIGSLKHHETAATLETRLDRARLAGFEIDLVVVTRAGKTPVDGGLLFASPTVFQRIYYSEQAGRLVAFAERATAGTRNSGPAANLLAVPFRALVPAPAYAQQTDLTTLVEALVAQGEVLFFKETFNGNGRTCGTCHPAENNFTIDPAFIATLPANDPLFVAEFIPALSQNFENPSLMRQFGLILENVDGFDDLESKFVMRGVPHTLALPTSLTPPPGPGPSQRTGWGGDGAPGSGSLRDFATGAVTQHFTKTLKRRPGKDFRLPTSEELDAMEMFQLSLGRQSDPDLNTLILKSAGSGVPDPVQGKSLFTDPAKRCSACHFNAGANVSFVPPPGTSNFNFNTGVENTPPVAGLPRDGGFGQDFNSGDGSFGDGTFNTPPVVEAADTCPCFHNNSAATIEDAVRFYTTAAFSGSPAGTPAIALTSQEIAAVGAFLRAINALENIRSSLDLAGKTKEATSFGQAKKLLRLSAHEVGDAIRVLQEVGLYTATGSAVPHLENARTILVDASDEKNKTQRDLMIDQAIAEELIAEAAMVQ
jgi:mono/diheme cytochrome c family protein